jgi:hypothetical protein
MRSIVKSRKNLKIQIFSKAGFSRKTQKTGKTQKNQSVEKPVLPTAAANEGLVTPILTCMRLMYNFIWGFSKNDKFSQISMFFVRQSPRDEHGIVKRVYQS